MVGRGGFEPPKRKRNRFTVCPLWPLGNLPAIQLMVHSLPRWQDGLMAHGNKTFFV